MSIRSRGDVPEKSIEVYLVRCSGDESGRLWNGRLRWMTAIVVQMGNGEEVHGGFREILMLLLLLILPSHFGVLLVVVDKAIG